MKLFFVSIDKSSEPDEMVVRAGDAARAAAIYATMLRGVENTMTADDVKPGDNLKVMGIPSPTGTAVNFGSLEPALFEIANLPEVERDFISGEEFPSEPTNLMLVKIEDMNGEDWNFVIEASNVEEARDLSISGYLDGESREDTNGIHAIVVQRLPAEKGEEGVLDWDMPLEIAFEFGEDNREP